MFERQTERRGLSSLELLTGCCAICIGLALGWVFMQPSAPEPTTSEVADTEAHDEVATTLEAKPVAGSANTDDVLQAIRQLQQEVTSLRESQDSQAAVSVNPAARARRGASAGVAVSARQQPLFSAVSDEEVGRRTLRYWNKLNEIMASEEAMRKPPSKGLTVANVGDFLSRRGQAGGFAARAIRKLDTENVDAAVVAQGMDIASWYDQGNSLNDTAKNLFNSSGTHERRGQPGQQWGDAEKAHGQSVGELNRRGDVLRREMIEKYGLPFPDLR